MLLAGGEEKDRDLGVLDRDAGDSQLPASLKASLGGGR